MLLTNQDTDDWQLIEPRDVTESEARTYSERGLSFAGVLTVTAERKPRSKFSVQVVDAVVTAASVEFVRRWARSVVSPMSYPPRSHTTKQRVSISVSSPVAISRRRNLRAETRV